MIRTVVTFGCIENPEFEYELEDDDDGVIAVVRMEGRNEPSDGCSVVGELPLTDEPFVEIYDEANRRLWELCSPLDADSGIYCESD